MADSAYTPPSGISQAAVPVAADRQPVVFARDGEVFANSRDVAAFFGKEHRNVMQAIDGLIAQEAKLGLLNFQQTPYVEPATGQTYRMFEMDQTGFTLLAMGFTGTKALKFKLRYIEAFNALQAEVDRLRNAPAAVLSGPQLMAAALIEADATMKAQAKQIEGMKRDVAAYERIAKADGSLCITDAAKALQMRRTDLFNWLRQNGWIYRRPGSGHDLGYQSKEVAGLLEHKVTTVLRADGSEKVTEQVRVTPKGLAKLAKLIRPVATLIEGDAA